MQMGTGGVGEGKIWDRTGLDRDELGPKRAALVARADGRPGIRTGRALGSEDLPGRVVPRICAAGGEPEEESVGWW